MSSSCFPFQQAQEMVQDILRERDHGGFNERNDFSARMGGGMDVSLCETEQNKKWDKLPLNQIGFKKRLFST